MLKLETEVFQSALGLWVSSNTQPKWRHQEDQHYRRFKVAACMPEHHKNIMNEGIINDSPCHCQCFNFCSWSSRLASLFLIHLLLFYWLLLRFHNLVAITFFSLLMCHQTSWTKKENIGSFKGKELDDYWEMIDGFVKIILIHWGIVQVPSLSLEVKQGSSMLDALESTYRMVHS